MSSVLRTFSSSPQSLWSWGLGSGEECNFRRQMKICLYTTLFFFSESLKKSRSGKQWYFFSVLLPHNYSETERKIFLSYALMMTPWEVIIDNVFFEWLVHLHDFDCRHIKFSAVRVRILKNLTSTTSSYSSSSAIFPE